MSIRIVITMLLIMFCMSFDLTLGNVYKTSEMTAAVNFNLAVERFQNLKKTMPRSWAELADVEECKSVLGAVEKESHNFRQVHRFLKSSKPVHISVPGPRVGDTVKKARVVTMGIGLAAPTRSQADGENFRNVILEYEGGEIRYLRMNELKLKAAFEAAGFHLEDYSGNDGEWEPEVIQNRTTSNQRFDPQVTPRAPLVIHEDALSQDASRIQAPWQWILVVTIVLLLLIGLWFGVRKNTFV